MRNKMRIIMTVAVLALAMAALPVISRAAEEAKPAEQKQEEAKVTGEVAASILSAYIWRGQELSRHSVVIQPSATVSYQGFSANIWGNLDTKPYASGAESYSSNFTETDVTLSYSRQFGIVHGRRRLYLLWTGSINAGWNRSAGFSGNIRHRGAQYAFGSDTDCLQGNRSLSSMVCDAGHFSYLCPA